MMLDMSNAKKKIIGGKYTSHTTKTEIMVILAIKYKMK